MTLQETIKADLKIALKQKDDTKKSTIRVIMGEFGRLDKKELPDDEVIKVLKKLIKAEKDTIEKSGGTEDSDFIRIINAYLPKEATEDEVEAWIKANIDFSAFNNKMQAMKPIMAHFGSRADGAMVKTILNRL